VHDATGPYAVEELLVSGDTTDRASCAIASRPPRAGYAKHRKLEDWAMLKLAGDLVVGDVYTERSQYRLARRYRVIELKPGPVSTIVRVVIENTTTGKRSVTGFFRVNRVEVEG
jgi:hypothetical protein